MNAIQRLRRAWAHRGGRDPVLEFFMNAPEDDEPVTPEEEEMIRQAKEEYEREGGIPFEEIRRRYP